MLDDLYIQKSKIYEFNNEMFIFGDITIHEFRHSHVTILRSMNYTIKQIGDTETTIIETYSHLFESDKFVISEGLNKLKLYKIRCKSYIK